MTEVSVDSSPNETGGGQLPHMRQLDGLRGIAIILVIATHSFASFDSVFPTGEAAVRLFFTLSGFLITGILLRCRPDSPTGDSSTLYTLRQFYMRRALRIFPVYYLVLAIGWQQHLNGHENQKMVWYLTYCTNWFVAVKLHWPGPLTGHFWSLGVEEQFYLFWPLLILLLPRKGLLPIVFLLTLSGLAFRWVGFHLWYALPGMPDRLYTATPSYLDSLGIGAMLAIIGDRRRVSRLTPRAFEHISLVLGLLTLLLVFGPLALWITGDLAPLVSRYNHVLLDYLQSESTPIHAKTIIWRLLIEPTRLQQHMEFFNLVFRDIPVVLLSAWLVAGAARGFRGDLGAWLGGDVIRFVGRISYGMYVWQALAAYIIAPALGGDPGIARNPILHFCVWMATTSIIAAASWYLFEWPLNSLKRFFPYSRKTTLSTIAA